MEFARLESEPAAFVPAFLANHSTLHRRQINLSEEWLLLRGVDIDFETFYIPEAASAFANEVAFL